MDLVPFWIIPPQPPAPKPGEIRTGGPPLGLGVTAFDLDDALWILRQTEYANYLASPAEEPLVRRDVRFDDLPKHVQQHMGPIVVRGLWYPVWRPFTARP